MTTPKAQIVYRSVDEINELEGNPRTISKDQFEKLKTSISNNGDYFEARPCILSDRTGKLVVIAGNQRLRAARALGLKEIPTVLLEGLTEEREREIIIRDNVENGEWNMDELANAWEGSELVDWGVELPDDWVSDEELGEIVENASEKTVTEYNPDLNYDLKKLVRERLSPEIQRKLTEGVENGEIRPEIKEILEMRAQQCVVFNFDEIIKFYRSGDASETEKELLKRLYLVYITPKEAFEAGMLEIEKACGEIYDNSLMEKTAE